jgi:hypothetical protein
MANTYSSAPMASAPSSGDINNNNNNNPAANNEAFRLQRLQTIAAQFEIRPDWIMRLRELESFDICVVADDSGSMATPVKSSTNNNTNPYGALQTRWTELRQTLSIVVELGSALNDHGIDVFFLNRPPVLQARSARDVQPAFDHKPPQGFTPLTRVVQSILAAKVNSERNLLLLIATDGQPTDDRGNVDIPQFISTLKSKGPKVFVQIMACTDDDSAIAYLESVDKTVPRVDVTDDYHSERAEILRAQGPRFPFSFGDYVVKSLLGSVSPYFDQMDHNESSCCTIS